MDLLAEHEKEIRGCLANGAYKVQIDFTEGRLAVKIDPSGSLLNSFIELMDMRDAEHAYSANLTVSSAARTMLTRTLDLLK